MSAPVVPTLEPRDAAGLEQALRDRLPAYLPGWDPEPGSSGAALLAIAGRYLHALAERIGQAPAKNELAFLDMIGVSLLTARAARAPVVFTPPPAAVDIAGSAATSLDAPAGTRLAATVPGRREPLVFETERGIGIATAPLAEVVTVLPGRDEYADHSAAAVGGRPFTLYEGGVPVAHELYLSHPTHLALAGQCAVELVVHLVAAAGPPLATMWEHWDGTGWRPFKPLLDDDRPGESLDGTGGLTRSGTLRLAAECAESAPRTVHGWEGLWIRGRVAAPLPPDPSRRSPSIDRVSIRTVIDRRLPAQGCNSGLQPDSAFADVRAIDMTKPFQPLGATPGPDSTFYLRHAEAFSKPGADVTICLRRPHTPQESNDIELAKYEAGVNAARQMVDQLRTLMGNLEAVLKALVDPATGDLRADGTPLFDTRAGGAADPNLYLDDFWSDVTGRMQSALNAARRCAPPAQTIQTFNVAQFAAVTAYDVAPEPISKGVTAVLGLEVLRWSAVVTLVANSEIVLGVADAMAALATPNATRLAELAALRTQLNGLGNNRNLILTGNLGQKIGAALAIVGSIPALAGAYATLVGNLNLWPAAIYLQARPAFIQTARNRYAEMRARIDRARNAINGAIGSATNLKALLTDLSPITLAAAAGVVKPMLPLPTLAWEYWNGARWRRLANVTSVDGQGQPSMAPRHFRHGSGRVSFTVPADWEPNVVNGEEGRWLRVRIVKGTFAIVKHVSWFDAQSQTVNFMPIIEARPPLLDRFFLGYHWASDVAAPERCLTYNDFEWADRTADAAWPGGGFEPFAPVRDLTPTLYLGFDGPLPAALLGLWVGAEEAALGAEVPALEWQSWDGREWAPLRVDDETRDLSRPGVCFVLAPGSERHERLIVVRGEGRAIELADPRAAARFTAGDRLHVHQGEAGEVAVVEAVDGARLRTASPLEGSYTRATAEPARLARFGTPRSWLRARLRRDGEPLRARVDGLVANATWAAQIETVEDELIGSSNGEPSQVHFLTRTPVLPGERIEVRELEGARAAVDYPMLVAELAGEGIEESQLRTVVDRATGRISEVWVPWRERPNLFFSGPGARDYTIERSRGRLLFGDNDHGRIPVAGADNLRARRYRSGGGTEGNLPADAISTLLSGVLVQGVRNVVPSEGGAEGEETAGVLVRGPRTVRHRRQAVSLDDYEALAREASPAVAVARALSRDPYGRAVPGFVTLVVVPHSGDARPQPSVELRREVREFVLARAPASLGGRLAVIGPRYAEAGVDASVAPVVLDAGGPVARAVEEAATAFFHPLTGRGGRGWEFGRDVYTSDVAALLEGVAGVDYVETLTLLAGGVPAGDRIAVDADRIVVAGALRIRLAGGAG